MVLVLDKIYILNQIQLINNGQPILINGVNAYTNGVTAELINLKVRSNSHSVPPYCHELTGKVIIMGNLITLVSKLRY